MKSIHAVSYIGDVFGPLPVEDEEYLKNIYADPNEKITNRGQHEKFLEYQVIQGEEKSLKHC